MLLLHIEAGLIHRQGKAAANFQRTLPSPQSNLVQQILKDPYNFDFLTLAEDAPEREVEDGLVHHPASGQCKRPFTSRLMQIHKPLPSQNKIIKRVLGLLTNKNGRPLSGSRPNTSHTRP